jgi:hypothetical protein
VPSTIAIQSPPDPSPISARAGNHAASPSSATKPTEPAATSASDQTIAVRVPRRATTAPPAQKPSAWPAAKTPTSEPIANGPVPVRAAISGATGAITL